MPGCSGKWKYWLVQFPLLLSFFQYKYLISTHIVRCKNFQLHKWKKEESEFHSWLFIFAQLSTYRLRHLHAYNYFLTINIIWLRILTLKVCLSSVLTAFVNHKTNKQRFPPRNSVQSSLGKEVARFPKWPFFGGLQTSFLCSLQPSFTHVVDLFIISRETFVG